MKNFLKSTVLSLAVLCLCACDDDKSYEDPGLEVTPHNIAGTWQLAEWNGAPLAEGSFVYIEFTRKDKLFTMYQNLDSFGTRKLMGRYDITTDVELGAIIMGQYDYGTGDWEHRYIVSDLDADTMTWTAQDDPSDISIYERCASIPDEITGATGEEPDTEPDTEPDGEPDGE